MINAKLIESEKFRIDKDSLLIQSRVYIEYEGWNIAVGITHLNIQKVRQEIESDVTYLIVSAHHDEEGYSFPYDDEDLSELVIEAYMDMHNLYMSNTIDITLPNHDFY